MTHRPDAPPSQPLAAWRWASAFQGPEHLGIQLGGGFRGAAVLVHGFPGSSAEMAALGRSLNAEGWSVDVITLPGFGPAIDSLEGRDRSEWLEAVRAAWRGLPTDKPRLIVGYSMGGALAMQVAAEVHPDACILLAPLSRLIEGPWQLIWPLVRTACPRLPVFRFLRPRWEDAKFRRDLGHLMPGVDLDDADVRAAIARFAVSTHMLDQVIATGRQSRLVAPRMTCPTLVVQGDRDGLVKPHHTRSLLGLLGGPVHYVEVAGEHEIVKLGHAGFPEAQRAVLAYLHERFGRAGA